MRIAIVSPVPIYPPHGGNRARLKELIAALEREGHEVMFILLWSRKVGDYDQVAHEAALGGNFHVLHRSPLQDVFYNMSRARRLIGRRVRARLGGRTFPLDHIDEIYYRPFSKALVALFESAPPHAVVTVYATFSRALEAAPPGALRVIDTHDSLHHTLPTSEERRGLQRADIVLAIQDEEAARFRGMLGDAADRVRVLSHILPNASRIDVTSTKGATFLGSSFAANITSLRWLVREVLPLITAAEPSFKLYLAGSICNDMPDHPDVVRLGRVEHLADAFKAAPISLNPICEGTGVKIKLLESMSLGLPTVSTAMGVTGLEPGYLGGVRTVPDGEPRLFASSVLELYRSLELRKALALQASEAASRWNDQQADRLREVFRKPSSS